jgi:signal transduction histidine kinase
MGKIALTAADDHTTLPPVPDPRVLLGSIVHDFNNLLTPIVSVLEEMQGRGAGTERQLKKIDGAIYCAFRAKTLAGQLLDLASPRPVRPGAIDIGWLLKRLETPLATLLSQRIRLDLEIADNLPKAFVDQQLIERALVHLVLNARDAMPAGGRVTIAVALDCHSTDRVRGSNPAIRLTVSDSSSGQDETRLKMAWEPQYLTKTNGAGLGLATVRQFVESQGGRLSIARAPRRGTTVDLWLPMTSPAVAM